MGSGFQRGNGADAGGSDIKSPSGVDVIVQVVRRVLSRDWAPSRAIVCNVVLRSV